MQILASALPGFRDLRAPLTAGYLWLILLWIAIRPDLKARPGHQIAGAVWDLGKAAGPIWVGLAIGIAAYLIGSVSLVLSPTLGGAVKISWNCADRFLGWLRKKAGWIPAMPIANPRNPLTPYMEPAVNGTVRENLQNNQDGRSNAEIHNFATQYVDFLVEEAAPEIERIVSLPATLLLTKDSVLFTEVDRLKAETQFRLAIAPPLAAIFGFLAWNTSILWMLCLIPVLVLLWQSHTRSLEYRYLMYGAIERGVIESDAVQMLRKMADD